MLRIARLLQRLGRAALCGALLAVPSTGSTDDADAESLKTAFLYNFAQFVTWPVPPETDFNLCIRSPQPLNSADTLAGKAVAQARIRVLRSLADRQLARCHMLYLGATEAGEIDFIRAALDRAPVLTVGDGPGAIQRGVMINLVLEGNRIQFDVNKEAADRTGLRISASLLRLARKVY